MIKNNVSLHIVHSKCQDLSDLDLQEKLSWKERYTDSLQITGRTSSEKYTRWKYRMGVYLPLGTKEFPTIADKGCNAMIKTYDIRETGTYYCKKTKKGKVIKVKDYEYAPLYSDIFEVYKVCKNARQVFTGLTKFERNVIVLDIDKEHTLEQFKDRLKEFELPFYKALYNTTSMHGQVFFKLKQSIHIKHKLWNSTHDVVIGSDESEKRRYNSLCHEIAKHFDGADPCFTNGICKNPYNSDFIQIDGTDEALDYYLLCDKYNIELWDVKRRYAKKNRKAKYTSEECAGSRHIQEGKNFIAYCFRYMNNHGGELPDREDAYSTFLSYAEEAGQQTNKDTHAFSELDSNFNYLYNYWVREHWDSSYCQTHNESLTHSTKQTVEQMLGNAVQTLHKVERQRTVLKLIRNNYDKEYISNKLRNKHDVYKWEKAPVSTLYKYAKEKPMSIFNTVYKELRNFILLPEHITDRQLYNYLLPLYQSGNWYNLLKYGWYKESMKITDIVQMLVGILLSFLLFHKELRIEVLDNVFELTEIGLEKGYWRWIPPNEQELSA